MLGIGRAVVHQDGLPLLDGLILDSSHMQAGNKYYDVLCTVMGNAEI